MKPVLFYDTETNGLPLWSEPSEHPDQPHITQLAAEITKLTDRQIEKLDQLHSKHFA